MRIASDCALGFHVHGGGADLDFAMKTTACSGEGQWLSEVVRVKAIDRFTDEGRSNGQSGLGPSPPSRLGGSPPCCTETGLWGAGLEGPPALQAGQ